MGVRPVTGRDLHGSRSPATQALEKLAISRVVRSDGLLCSNQSVETGNRNLDAIQLKHFGITRSIFPGDTTSLRHQIHHHFVGDTNDVVPSDLVIGERPSKSAPSELPDELRATGS